MSGYLREEPAVSPPCAKPGADILHVVQDAVPVGAESDRAHCGVPPVPFEIGGGGIRRDRQRHGLDVVGEAYTGERVGGRKEAQTVLHLGHDLGALRVAELKVGRRPLHDDDADRYAPFEVRARWSTRPRADRPRARSRRRHDRGAFGHVPILAVSRPSRLGPSVALRLAQLKRREAQAFDLREPICRLRDRRAGSGRCPARKCQDPHPAVAMNWAPGFACRRRGRHWRDPFQNRTFLYEKIACHVTPRSPWWVAVPSASVSFCRRARLGA